jgi:uncharacterized protein YgiM (DUF1202 family)
MRQPHAYFNIRHGDITLRIKNTLFVLALAATLACSSLTAPRTTDFAWDVVSASATPLPSPTQSALSERTCVVVAAQSLNLRATPGTDSAVIVVLDHGDILTILEDAPRGVWVRVQSGDYLGWINSNYCKSTTR